MAQFRGTITGSRDTTISKLGHKTTGLTTTCNAWNIGVTCRAVYDDKLGKDVIEVYETGGSSPKKAPKLIAVISE
tara:strand:+ start:1287 stop:1511 length:225 start_codon:yes stop_codon:yes gene_type:complete